MSHLFSITKDGMSMSTLLTCLKAVMPVNKCEDFDMPELVRGLVALEQKGMVRFGQWGRYGKVGSGVGPGQGALGIGLAWL